MTRKATVTQIHHHHEKYEKLIAATTGLPPGLIIGHCAAVSDVSRKPDVMPVMPPLNLRHASSASLSPQLRCL